ncbi:MBL fold metallo-hydrolase [Hydrogenibacillus sp. N12]|uniref:MBL fold metallo-hydrolase n=1 Tax=Hydrogenibacillus sp. N12 TaxID=2866627 RepID=UPI001C7D6B5D|nr:MBL fold metallo-hydrolase [Hydrogenibacillus sp. N12]QZA33670.1 MBL fold metallo-hydrolase [Hydrogenibacillus sp. N12]
MAEWMRLQPAELAQKLGTDEPVFLIDVRSNPKDVQDWHIEHRNVEFRHFPAALFLEEASEAYAELPKDREIHVVCAKGLTSAEVARRLAERGYQVAELVGGMEAWSQYYHPVTAYEDEKLKIVQFNRLGKGCLSYAIISENEMMVVDPLRRADVYADFAREHGLTIRHIVDTHIHADHISGGQALSRLTGAPYYVSSHDVFTHQGGITFEPLEQYKTLRVGDVEVEVVIIPTPGHTPGSTSLLVDRRFFLSGDTVFVSGLGRPDLGGMAEAWAKDLYETVVTKLKDLPDDLLVLPAHYSHHSEINAQGIVGATLGELRQANDMLREMDRETFLARVEAAASTVKPPNYEKIIAINVGKLAVSDQEAIELEIGPNRCAVHHATA